MTTKLPIKVLARGEIGIALTVKAHKFTGKAAEKIAAAGGSVETLASGAAGRDRMVESIRNICKVPDLRKRVLFTLGLLGVYRIGNHIPTPGVNTEALALLAEQTRNTMFGMYSMFSAAACRR